MLPFTVHAQSETSLTGQVTTGLRRSIEHGHFRPGTPLPTLKEMAAELGVSLVVVRVAVKGLAREGLVTARPRRGIEVSAAGPQRWRGHVLYLHWGSANSYYTAVCGETLVRQLLAQRVLVTPVHLTGVEAAADWPQLRSIIRAGPVDLAVVDGDVRLVGMLLTEHEIPFVHMASAGTEATPSRLAQRTLLQDARPALEQAMRHVLNCGVRTVGIVVHSGDGGPLKPLATAAGLSVLLLPAPPVTGLGLPESVERGGMKCLLRRLAANEPLPELLYFADDYLARGGLTALLARGIRIPEDVQVITWANRSLGPVFPVPLTRIEMDPRRDGQTLTELAMATLKNPGRKIKEPEYLGPEFIVGQSTRPHA